MSPFFSTQAVSGLDPIIQSKLDMVCTHLSRTIGTEKTLELHALSACFAADVMSTYLFNHEMGLDTWKSQR